MGGAQDAGAGLVLTMGGGAMSHCGGAWGGVGLGGMVWVHAGGAVVALTMGGGGRSVCAGA